MKVKIFFLSVLLIACSLFTVHSQVLDQSYLTSNSGTSARNLPGYSIFQSFTAGITGTLVEVDMGVFNYINGGGTLKIYAGGDTTGALLQSTFVTVNCPSGNCFAAFTVAVAVTQGQVYTFRFIPGAGIPDPYGVQVENPGTYTGGQFGLIDPSGVSYPGFDMVFRTWVMSETTGIASIDNDKPEMTIYPNPSSGLFQLTTNTQQAATLTIYNLIGAPVYQSAVANQQTAIDLGTQPKGIYIAELNLDNSGILRKVLVLN